MGVDENGLGPRLGPLVASSVTLRTSSYRRGTLCRRGLALGLTDSKQTGGFGRMGFTESVALALIERVCGQPPPSADALLDGIAPGTREQLRTRCPNESTSAQCWGSNLDLPMFGGDVTYGRTLLDRLIGRSSLRIADVQTRVACPGMLNSRLAEGRNKLAVDLELFEDLIVTTQARQRDSLLAVCGMIGGIRDYAARFGRFEQDRVAEPQGRRGQRKYAVQGIGEIRFEVDADARHLPVALASIVGKYVREICMRRIGAFYQEQIPEITLASGYHDPVTTRFIQATEPERRRLRIADNCFQRQA